MIIKKVKCFTVKRNSPLGYNPNRFVISGGENHKQWIIDNCGAPNEPAPEFIDFELPIIIDESGWYASKKGNLWWVEYRDENTIVGYLIGSIMIDKNQATKSLNRQRNNLNSKIAIFDITGRRGGLLDNQVIVSKFEF